MKRLLTKRNKIKFGHTIICQRDGDRDIKRDSLYINRTEFKTT